ncbi:hypothetical protein EC968_005194 [Mortierella alpina]|nr:hypothetical protein EC968_005194 [Mortierella alpina]
MPKVTGFVWLAVLAMAMVNVHSAPTGPLSNRADQDSNVGPILLLDTDGSQNSLVDQLRDHFESSLGNTSAFTSYSMMMNDPSIPWQVWKLEHCQATIDVQTMPPSLHCDEKSPSYCNFAYKTDVKQTLATEDGLKTEVSLSMSGGEPGIAEIKMSFSRSESHSVTRSFSKGKEFDYTFPVAVGRTCTPTIAYYYLSCEGTRWDTLNDAVSESCSDFTNSYNIDFKDPTLWSQSPDSKDWYQHFNFDKNQGNHLFSFHVRDQMPPKSCDDIVQLVDKRSLADIRDQRDVNAFLRYTNDQSISMISCVY